MTVNVGHALTFDTAEKITVHRRVGESVDGLFVSQIESTFRTLASVQQPTPKQVAILVEGRRNADVLLFISAKPLRGTNNRTKTIGDHVIYKGETYEIQNPQDWAMFGHTTAVGVRLE